MILWRVLKAENDPFAGKDNNNTSVRFRAIAVLSFHILN